MIFDPTLFYDAIVVSNKVDPEMRGGVRARIIGYTDELDDDSQPFVYPELMCANAVPEKGYYLQVKFEDGNIYKGKYVAVSQTKDGFYSYEYMSSTAYPNVAVYNLGGDGYMKYYDRVKEMTTIDCPNGGHVIWDGESKVLFSSDKAYRNAGDGATNGNGKPEHNVLTEASIDIFTCMPVGRGEINQGSEYLCIPQVSTKTVETYKNATAEASDGSVVAVELDGSDQFADILDANGATVDEVELSLTRNVLRRTDKVIDKIIVGSSDGLSFPDVADKCMKSGSQYSAHYVIGRVYGAPEVKSDNPLGILKNSGFYQFVNLSDDAYFANSSVDSNGEPANQNAVSIILIKNGLVSTSEYTSYQINMVKELIEHIRYVAGDTSIPVYDAGDLEGSPKLASVGIKFD